MVVSSHVLAIFRQSSRITGRFMLGTSKFDIQGKRFLFSNEYLGTDSFLKNRVLMCEKFSGLKDEFVGKMDEYLKAETKNMVFTDDLKSLAFIAETDDDINLLTRMIKRYNSQNKALSFNHFVFGPVIMRLLYMTKNSDKALELFKDSELSEFFDQLSSKLVLMDLLYEQGRYDDVLDVFSSVIASQQGGVRYPISCYTLALAACYKQNTRDSYKKMSELVENGRKSGAQVPVRCISYAAMLALKQGEAQVALELTSAVQKQNSAVSNIQAMAYCDLDRVEDALTTLRSILQRDLPDHVQRSVDIFPDAIDRIKKALAEKNDTELTQKFQVLERTAANGHKIATTDIGDFICSTIHRPRTIQSGFMSRVRAPPGGFPPRQGRGDPIQNIQN